MVRSVGPLAIVPLLINLEVPLQMCGQRLFGDGSLTRLTRLTYSMPRIQIFRDASDGRLTVSLFLLLDLRLQRRSLHYTYRSVEAKVEGQQNNKEAAGA